MSCAWLDGARDVSSEASLSRGGGKKCRNIPEKRLDSLSLVHDGPAASCRHVIEKGLRTTKFRRGFQRRQIAAPHREDIEESKNAEHRRRALLAVDKANGFDVISGAYDESKITRSRKECRHLSDRPSEEILKGGEIFMRNSQYRYYCPEKSRPHPLRQELLINEGLLKPKYTSVLGIGRAEMASAGVEDQFSKAEYQQYPSMTSLVDHLRPSHTESAGALPRARVFGGTWRRA